MKRFALWALLALLIVPASASAQTPINLRAIIERPADFEGMAVTLKSMQVSTDVQKAGGLYLLSVYDPESREISSQSLSADELVFAVSESQFKLMRTLLKGSSYRANVLFQIEEAEVTWPG